MVRVAMGRARPTTEWSEGEASDIQFISPSIAPATSHDAIIVAISDVAGTVEHDEVESKNGFRKDNEMKLSGEC
jgi:hypothetical protein